MRYLGNRLVMAGALALSTWASAQAADMPYRYPPPPPPAMPVPYVVPMFSWTGFYVGGNIGYGFGKGDGDISIAGVGNGPIEGDGNGFLGGLQAGYNWQAGSLLLGVEADIQGSTAKSDITGSLGGETLMAESENPWFGTLRGRIGFASDRWLLYVTAGAAYGETDLSGDITGAGGGSFNSSETWWAWTVGAGAEWALWDRWSTKLEYLYIGSPSEVPTPPGTRRIDGDVASHIIRIGLNYRF